MVCVVGRAEMRTQRAAAGCVLAVICSLLLTAQLAWADSYYEKHGKNISTAAALLLSVR